MLEPDQWESVLGSITGTVYRGTERVSSRAKIAHSRFWQILLQKDFAHLGKQH